MLKRWLIYTGNLLEFQTTCLDSDNMTFDYEKSVWGTGTATLSFADPSNIRLRRVLRAIKNLPAGARLVEVGCGAGAFIRAVKAARPELLCFGTDLSKEAIAAALAQNDGVVYSPCGENSMPFADADFDALIFIDVLEHVFWPANFLGEVNRVLKVGGTLAAFVPCEGDSLSLWRWLDSIGLKMNLTRIFAGHVNYFSREQLLKLLDAAGFYVQNKSYSEHVFGQILGVAAFYSMKNRQRSQGGQLNNEAYFRDLGRKGGRAYALLRSAANFLVSLESMLFNGIPSPNAFITAIKR